MRRVIEAVKLGVTLTSVVGALVANSTSASTRLRPNFVETYRETLLLSGYGIGTAFEPSLAFPYLHATYVGQMSAAWHLEFDVKFLIDRAAHTIDAEPGPNGGTELGIVLSSTPTFSSIGLSNSMYLWSEDSYSLSATDNTGSTTCIINAKSFQAVGQIQDDWGYGPSQAAYKSGAMTFTFTGGSSRPNFHCSNGGGIDVDGNSVPGYDVSGDIAPVGSTPGCKVGALPEFPIPIASVGGPWEMGFDHVYKCQTTHLAAMYTAISRYTVELRPVVAPAMVSATLRWASAKVDTAVAIADLNDLSLFTGSNANTYSITRIASISGAIEQVRIAEGEIPGGQRKQPVIFRDLTGAVIKMSLLQDSSLTPFKFEADLNTAIGALRAAEQVM
jgi:hypothetical protein